LLKKNEEPKYHDELDVFVGLGLFPPPAHIVEQHLLVVPTLVDICNAVVLGERIDRSPILANGLGIKTHGLNLMLILLDFLEAGEGGFWNLAFPGWWQRVPLGQSHAAALA